MPPPDPRQASAARVLLDGTFVRLKMRQILLLVALEEPAQHASRRRERSMTQPRDPLLADLERLLGLQLFERSARGYRAELLWESLIGMRR